jgi:hypothetical protein
MSEAANWRANGARYHVDATVARHELERINARDGGVSAPGVVQAARPAKAPLHPAFEWDNGVAGESWREHQARNLIRSIRIIGPSGHEAPMFVSVAVQAEQGPPQRVYRPLLEVVSEPTALASAIELLMEKLASAQAALDDVREAASAVGVDDIRLARVTAITEALMTARTLAGSLAA